MASRRSPLSYGVKYKQRQDLPKAGPGQRLVWSQEASCYMLQDAFVKFVDRGQVLDVDERVTKYFQPSTSSQTTVSFRIYATGDNTAKLITGASMKLLRVREYVSGKGRGVGRLLAWGLLTPCLCYLTLVCNIALAMLASHCVFT